MITIRRSSDRGYVNHEWLKSFHTFTFGSYYDPNQMGFRVLRVINEDRVLPNNGFGLHSHKDMEIISYVVAGKLEHKDSLGNGSVISAGEFQIITAGTGVAHSEFNPSENEETHFYQIWILPHTKSLKPNYDQKSFHSVEGSNDLQLVASSSAKDGSLLINQDVNIYKGKINPESQIKINQPFSRYAWLQLISGKVLIDDNFLESGDGAAISETSDFMIKAETESQFLLFDLP